MLLPPRARLTVPLVPLRGRSQLSTISWQRNDAVQISSPIRTSYLM
ncbi:hypothetical protein A8926_2268 [Saccharopolyspora spinosa]|uniref:Uncharacterized protein n=2 Tax=Saccharopolyspora spinosa TaxID=60894 RepID=A0A2N3XVE7_SACSN|nr:hypothetical protein A8926_2268 [Saccharopolyspora spinosa]